VFHFKTFPQGNDFSYKVAIFGDLGNFNGVSMPYLQKAAMNGEFDLAIHVGMFQL
jgi:acid phosphatase type 7